MLSALLACKARHKEQDTVPPPSAAAPILAAPPDALPTSERAKPSQPPARARSCTADRRDRPAPLLRRNGVAIVHVRRFPSRLLLTAWWRLRVQLVAEPARPIE